MGSSNIFTLALLMGLAIVSANATVLAPVSQSSNLIDGCVIDCSKGVYFAHTRDCTKFIQCAPWGPVVMDCAEGTMWNQELLTCDHLETTVCETGNYFTPEGRSCPEEDPEDEPTEAPEPPTAAPTQPPTPAPTQKAPTDPPAPAPTTQPPQPEPTQEEETTVAPAEPTSDPAECDFQCPWRYGIFSHPRDCSKYFVCFRGKAVEKSCTLNRHYSKVAKRCVLPILSFCNSNPLAEC